ncbi:GNAT family N-acetyltransferase [Phytoactinopolyspora limicola]|uniref:GNAT family N-acetyltransferase n=1 Tax=Phytoactinopolyspora limicola TaxID=2715536 RepID=UPI00140C1053|nr:GNAT family N-acetyltransferase [Phytoactinopolyspora limicola]
MPVTIATETPLQDDVRLLIAQLNEYLRPLSPPEFQHQMTVEEMAGPDTTVFVARADDGMAVGCGALRVHDDGLGEVKRMFTVPESRGLRVGSLLLDAIIERANAEGLGWLMLETGVGPGFAPAWRLYRSKGFRPRGRFLDYPASDWSTFFELKLSTT